MKTKKHASAAARRARDGYTTDVSRAVGKYVVGNARGVAAKAKHAVAKDAYNKKRRKPYKNPLNQRNRDLTA